MSSPVEQPMQPAPLLAVRLEDYDFDNDARFVQGIQTLKLDTPEAILKAKLFYFNKYIAAQPSSQAPPSVSPAAPQVSGEGATAADADSSTSHPRPPPSLSISIPAGASAHPNTSLSSSPTTSSSAASSLTHVLGRTPPVLTPGFREAASSVFNLPAPKEAKPFVVPAAGPPHAESSAVAEGSTSVLASEPAPVPFSRTASEPPLHTFSRGASEVAPPSSHVGSVPSTSHVGSPQDAQYTLGDIMRILQAGMEVPGVKKVDVEVANHLPPSPSVAIKPAKPWETATASRHLPL